MVVLKLIGSALVVFSGARLGANLTAMLLQRVQFIKKTIAAAEKFEEQICFFKREKEQIYTDLLNSGFDRQFVDAIKSSELTQNYLKSLPFLSERDKELFNEFFSALGHSDSTREQERILVYIKLFKKQFSEAQTEYKTKSKLYKSIGFWGGVGVAIFLI